MKPIWRFLLKRNVMVKQVDFGPVLSMPIKFKVFYFFPFRKIKDWLIFLCLMCYARVYAPRLIVINCQNIDRNWSILLNSKYDWSAKPIKLNWRWWNWPFSKEKENLREDMTAQNKEKPENGHLGVQSNFHFCFNLCKNHTLTFHIVIEHICWRICLFLWRSIDSGKLLL